ncbi:ABC transporter substrate-binding protein [Chloroflexi bacterium TSY]|nr:ABC transporter substrate-binding protein [Chloroflexi bacterium TSY]
MKNQISRREFLQVTALSGAGMLLAGCPAPGSSGTSSSAAPSGPIPILMWYESEQHGREYSQRIDEMNEALGIDWTVERLSSDALKKKFTTTLMSGQGFPDIVENNNGFMVSFLKGEDSEIPIVALNPWLESSEYTDQVLPSRWDIMTKDGNRYGAPHDVHPIVLIYNKRGWDAVGVDPATWQSWDDYLAACEELGADAETDDGRPIFGIHEVLDGGQFRTRLLQNGIWWTTPEGEPNILEDGFSEAVQNFLRFAPYRSGVDWNNPTIALLEGTVLTQCVPDWFYGNYVNATRESETYADEPYLGARMVPEFPATGSWGGTSIAVVKQSPNVEKAVETLLYLYFDNSSDQLIERFDITGGILPPITTIWDHPHFQEESEMIPGIANGQLLIEAAGGLPGYSETWTTGLVSQAYGEQATLLWEGEIDVETALATADANARELIEQNA